MKTIQCFATVISALQRQQNHMTQRLFAMGLALAGAGMVQIGDTTGGQLWAGTVIGDSTLGTFSGTYAETGSGHHFREGMVTCEFRHGSLAFEYQYDWEGGTSILWTGTYVVSGGTGLFEGATGEGIIIVVSPGGPTGPWSLSGTLSR